MAAYTHAARVAILCGCLTALSGGIDISALSAAAAAGPTATTGDALPAPTASPGPVAAAASDPCGGPARLLATLNRPTVGYSACAVPKASIVLEEGYQINQQGGADAKVTAAYPQGFERVGVADRFEVDLIGPAFNRMRAGTAITSGYSDLGLGFKYELPQAGRFTYAFDGLFTAATGSGGFGNGGPSQTLDADVSYMLSPAVGVGTTLAASSTAGNSQSSSGANGSTLTARYGSFDPSLVVTAQIPNYYQFYVELVGLTKIAPEAGGRVFTDFGLQKLLGRNVEVDLEYGIDFTPVNGSRFQYIGSGLGLRLN